MTEPEGDEYIVPKFSRCGAVECSQPHRQCALSTHEGRHSFEAELVQP